MYNTLCTPISYIVIKQVTLEKIGTQRICTQTQVYTQSSLLFTLDTVHIIMSIMWRSRRTANDRGTYSSLI